MQEGTSGLYYVRARYYDSDTGRFISRDPIKAIGPRNINPYQYAYNNPKLYIDPKGDDGWPVVEGPPVTEDWARRMGIVDTWMSDAGMYKDEMDKWLAQSNAAAAAKDCEGAKAALAGAKLVVDEAMTELTIQGQTAWGNRFYIKGYSEAVKAYSRYLRESNAKVLFIVREMDRIHSRMLANVKIACFSVCNEIDMGFIGIAQGRNQLQTNEPTTRQPTGNCNSSHESVVPELTPIVGGL